MPLIFHWYCGLAPGFWGVAVKVTDVPVQTGLADVLMDTETGSRGVIDIVITFEVAGFGNGQRDAGYRMQDTRSLSDGG